MKQLKEMTTKELVEEYNLLSGKSITRFSTRANGERMVQNLRDAQPEAAPALIKDVNRSKGVSESWNDSEVAEKRKFRINVSVDGVAYRSVKFAFEQLGLPLVKHIPFRMALKEAGKAVFEHEDKNYNFEMLGAE